MAVLLHFARLRTGRLAYSIVDDYKGAVRGQAEDEEMLRLCPERQFARTLDIMASRG